MSILNKCFVFSCRTSRRIVIALVMLFFKMSRLFIQIACYITVSSFNPCNYLTPLNFLLPHVFFLNVYNICITVFYFFFALKGLHHPLTKVAENMVNLANEEIKAVKIFCNISSLLKYC